MVLVKYDRMAVSLGLLLGGHDSDSSPPLVSKYHPLLRRRFRTLAKKQIPERNGWQHFETLMFALAIHIFPPGRGLPIPGSPGERNGQLRNTVPTFRKDQVPWRLPAFFFLSNSRNRNLGPGLGLRSKTPGVHRLD
jgi:hypothetical protein